MGRFVCLFYLFFPTHITQGAACAVEDDLGLVILYVQSCAVGMNLRALCILGTPSI